MKSGIYKIISKVNGKVYIGQSKNMKGRIGNHKCKLKNNKHNNNHLQRHVNIYGIDDLIFEVLEYCVEDMRDERERYWISFYDSMNHDKGFNMESGGNNNKSVSIETRKKQSKSRKGVAPWNKGIPLSLDAKIKISETLKGRFCKENHPSFGKKRTEETLRKMSENRKGITAWNKGIKNESISGEKHPMYGKKHSIESRRKMSSKLKGMFKGEKNPNYGKPLSKACREAQLKSVIGKPPWNKGLKMSEESIEKNRKSHIGKIPWNKGKVNESIKGKNNPSAKSVICLNNLLVFDTTKDAAKWCGLSKGNNISSHCKGKHKSTGKHPETGEPLRWMYYSDYLKLQQAM